MLLANESAARVAKEHTLPFVYRVHDAPSSEKIDALQEGLLRMGAEVPGHDKCTAKNAGRNSGKGKQHLSGSCHPRHGTAIHGKGSL